jgi:hypothetical protein
MNSTWCLYIESFKQVLAAGSCRFLMVMMDEGGSLHFIANGGKIGSYRLTASTVTPKFFDALKM